MPVPWPLAAFKVRESEAAAAWDVVHRLEREAPHRGRAHLTSLLRSSLITDQATVYLLGQSIRRLLDLGVQESKLRAKLTSPGAFASACGEIVAAARLGEVLDTTSLAMDWRTDQGRRPDVRVVVGGTEYSAEFKGLRASDKELAHRAVAASWASEFSPSAVGGGHLFCHLREPWLETDTPEPLGTFEPPGARSWRVGELDLCGWSVEAPADLEHEVRRFRAKFREAAAQLPQRRPGIVAIQCHAALPADLCGQALDDEFERSPSVVACVLTLNMIGPVAFERFDQVYSPASRDVAPPGALLVQRQERHTPLVASAASYNDYRAYRYWARNPDGAWCLIADSTASGPHEAAHLPVSPRLVSPVDESQWRPPRPHLGAGDQLFG